MKNDSNPIIRSEEVTIDMHICAALSESRSSGEIYFAAIAPDMELTVITLDEAPDILRRLRTSLITRILYIC